LRSRSASINESSSDEKWGFIATPELSSSVDEEFQFENWCELGESEEATRTYLVGLTVLSKRVVSGGATAGGASPAPTNSFGSGLDKTVPQGLKT